MNYEDEIEDESLEEDDEITVIIAELDWKPIQDKLNWRDPNFTKDIVKRLKGITEESFAEEVNIWQENINSLPVYDEMGIRKEIAEWKRSEQFGALSTQDQQYYENEKRRVAGLKEVVIEQTYAMKKMEEENTMVKLK
jgi:hypothetical protein